MGDLRSSEEVSNVVDFLEGTFEDCPTTTSRGGNYHVER